MQEIRVFTVTVRHKDRPQLVIAYGHIAFLGREETRTALRQMHLGRPTGFEQLELERLGRRIAQELERGLGELLAQIQAQTPFGDSKLAQLVFESIVLAQPIPNRLPGLTQDRLSWARIWATHFFQLHSELITRVWEDLEQHGWRLEDNHIAA